MRRSRTNSTSCLHTLRRGDATAAGTRFVDNYRGCHAGAGAGRGRVGSIGKGSHACRETSRYDHCRESSSSSCGDARCRGGRSFEVGGDDARETSHDHAQCTGTSRHRCYDDSSSDHDQYFDNEHDHDDDHHDDDVNVAASHHDDATAPRRRWRWFWEWRRFRRPAGERLDGSLLRKEGLE